MHTLRVGQDGNASKDARPLSYAAQPRAQLTSTGYAARSTSPLQADSRTAKALQKEQSIGVGRLHQETG
eukprot:5796031-Amphidinium_carterae.1